MLSVLDAGGPPRDASADVFRDVAMDTASDSTSSGDGPIVDGTSE